VAGDSILNLEKINLKTQPLYYLTNLEHQTYLLLHLQSDPPSLYLEQFWKVDKTPIRLNDPALLNKVSFLAVRVFQWKQLENLYFRDKKFSIEVHDKPSVVQTLSSFNLYEDALKLDAASQKDALVSAI